MNSLQKYKFNYTLKIYCKILFTSKFKGNTTSQKIPNSAYRNDKKKP